MKIVNFLIKDEWLEEICIYENSYFSANWKPFGCK
jgi:hypothetical protein